MKNSRVGNSIQKKEFNLSPPMNVDPELVKKLAELTDKIDHFERAQELDTQGSFRRGNKKPKDRLSSPPRKTISFRNDSPGYQRLRHQQILHGSGAHPASQLRNQKYLEMSGAEWQDPRTTSISPIALGQHAKKK